MLFLCTGNACRSQMAEGWARRLHGNLIEPFSAGIEKHGLDARAVRVMAEAGVDISGQTSKTVAELLGRHSEASQRPFDWVVTLCGHANENCPYLPGAVKRLHAGFADPARLAAGAKSEREALGHYRRARDQIREFIEKLPAALL